jgi:predicted nucleotidyltransferase component of viral defense system
MRKDFVNEVARTQKVKRADLIEKDLILHHVLFDLSKNTFFHDNFAFKGGTCLAKCYLDYFRFSEDIDFTWKNQSVFCLFGFLHESSKKHAASHFIMQKSRLTVVSL